uniref:DOMON-like domain-containing protein n=1 Tax=uncultured Sphingomonas sp. TaxID=158754 RepID=UPI0025D9302B|nr:DOMON-like domain-containing protein [uncultured Sphingomonas sp.]
MSVFQLQPHPTSRPTVEKVEVLIWRDEGQFDLDVRLFGSPLRAKLPPWNEPQRRDQLWRTTCFEAFIRPQGDASYYELNLAPAGHWAAYRFDDYRSGMRNAAIDAQPDPDILFYDGIWVQEAAFDFRGEPELDPSRPWQIGLSAVIEEEDGTKSYWALAHGHGPPDFHNPACFAYWLPPFAPE